MLLLRMMELGAVTFFLLYLVIGVFIPMVRDAKKDLKDATKKGDGKNG